MNRVHRLFTVIITLSLIVAMLIGLGKTFPSHASEVYYNQYLSVMVSSDDDGYCNLRSGPGLEYGVIQPIYNNTRLGVDALTKNYNDGLVWGRTYYNGYTGWIAILTTYVEGIQNACNVAYDVRVTAPEYIALRKGPGAEFDLLSKPYEGQVLRINQTVVNNFDGRPWGQTTINGIRGWVSLNWTYRDSSATYTNTKDVMMSDNQYYAIVTVGDDATSFKDGPGSGYPLIQWMPRSISIYVTRTMNNSQDGLVWGETTYNGRIGWTPMNYTTVTSVNNAATVRYSVSVQNSSNLKLRSGPGTEYNELVSYIPGGTSLYITQTMINSFDGRPWGKTSYNGRDGWISLNWTYRAPGT